MRVYVCVTSKNHKLTICVDPESEDDEKESLNTDCHPNTSFCKNSFRGDIYKPLPRTQEASFM